jgi:hypothetical protein
MPSFYHSESVQWTSSPKKGKSHGKRNSVTIKNGKGTKKVEVLNAKGALAHGKTVKLSKKEVRNVLKGNFMPGFWQNCATGNCLK